MRIEDIEYSVEGRRHVGHLAMDDTLTGRRPAVLVNNGWPVIALWAGVQATAVVFSELTGRLLFWWLEERDEPAEREESLHRGRGLAEDAPDVVGVEELHR